MRIAIDLVIVEKKFYEILSSLHTLLNQLAQVDQENEYIIITGRPREYRTFATKPRMRIYPVKIQPWESLLIKHQLILPEILYKVKPDVLHIPTCVAPIGWNGPLVITLHHIACLSVQDQLYSLQHYWQVLWRESLSRAQCILVTSETICDKVVSLRIVEKERLQLLRMAEENSALAVTRAYQEAWQISKGWHDHKLALVQVRFYPSVSVIIPASRPEKASQALEALSRQRYLGRIETIVVGLPRDTLAKPWPIISVNPEPIHEPGRARNLGAMSATGDILLFLDDDMVVMEDWVAQNVNVLQQPKVGVVGVRMPGRSQSFFARCVDFTNCGYYQHRRAMEGPVGSGSMGMHRSVFEAVGGFDQTLCSGEDIDLCYRIQKQGYRIVYQPSIVVVHDHQNDTLSKLLRYNYAHGFAGGLTTKIRHKDIGLKNRLLFSVRHPFIFLLLIPIMAVLATLQIVAINMLDNKRVLLYAPFILLGKLSYEFGIFKKLLERASSQVEGK